MYSVKVEKECGCFRNSDLENNISFDTKDDALTEAINMSNQMNDEFCGKHNFIVTEEGNDLLIAMEMPKSHGGGCCGGGHCS